MTTITFDQRMSNVLPDTDKFRRYINLLAKFNIDLSVEEMLFRLWIYQPYLVNIWRRIDTLTKEGPDRFDKSELKTSVLIANRLQNLSDFDISPSRYNFDISIGLQRYAEMVNTCNQKPLHIFLLYPVENTRRIVSLIRLHGDDWKYYEDGRHIIVYKKVVGKFKWDLPDELNDPLLAILQGRGTFDITTLEGYVSFFIAKRPMKVVNINPTKFDSYHYETVYK